LGRILILYALWTAIYYPIVVESQNMTNYWRRCILSGSYYHLWYYPAMIVAVILTWLFFRNRGGIAVGIAFVCYFIGCMGESYYGFFADNEAVTTLAEKYFALFWSTRSGLFFGFFFFALGAYLQKARWTMSRRKAAVALAISFALMAVEILTLRSFGVAKDYNLYFALIPATLFLFLSMGIVLGSPISVAILLLYIPIIALRMNNEEQVLEKGLDGYKAYKTRVKYKVIPFIW